jgi:hypothetical protein
MTYPVYRDNDGLAHGKRDFIVEKDPLPRGTTGTCVPCTAVLVRKR